MDNVFEDGSSRYIVELVKEDRFGFDTITLNGSLENGEFVSIKTPLFPILESVDYSNRFYAITGIIVLIIASILVLIFAYRVTEPISQLNKITKSMANLDFSSKFKGDLNDEVGELGYNINKMSLELEKNIGNLQVANLKLKKDINQKEKIDDMRKLFISNVSHELKTPIALIMGYAEGLKDNVNDDIENKNFYCDVIIDETKKMNKMVLELLELSKLHAGTEKIKKINFGLN